MLDHYTIQKVEFLCSPQRPQDIFYSSLSFPNFLLPIPDLRLDKYVSYESIKEEIGESQESINIDTEIFHIPDVAELIPECIQVPFGIFNALLTFMMPLLQSGQ